MAEKSKNVVNLLGRLGRDAETKFTGSGVAVTNFTIATTRSYKVGEEWKEETEWTNCVMWRGEKVAEYLTKGSRVDVTGRLQTRKYEKDGVTHYSTEVVVESRDVILLGAKDGNGQKAPASAPSAPPPADGSGVVDEEGLPF